MSTIFVLLLAMWMLKLFGVAALPWWVVLSATALYMIVVAVALIVFYLMLLGFKRLISPLR